MCGKKANSALAHILSGAILTDSFYLFIFICTDQMTIENLLKDTAYQVQIRHRSIQVLNPLWSDWSPVVTVPAGEPTILEFGTWSAR